MLDGETVRFIREEIRRNLNIILTGMSGENTVLTEDIDSQYQGMATIPQRPIMHPYGFVSRAKKKTTQVTAQVGDHLGNKFVLGHIDTNKPQCDEGEAVFYNAFGEKMHLKNGELVGTLKKVTITADGDIQVTTTGKLTSSVDGDQSSTVGGDMTEDVTGDKTTTATTINEVGKVNLGSKNALEPYVLGLVFKTFMTQVLTQIQAITVTCAAPGNPSSPPLNAAAFAALAASPLGDNTILSDKIKGEK